jgi:carotenoid cleavage dioxygenase-like enzyme
MNQYFIILDNSIKFDKARDPIDERLVYAGDDTWLRGLNKAHKYTDVNTAITEAKRLRQDNPVKVCVLQQNGPHINVGEVNF